MISQHRLKELFVYSPDTGNFTRRVPRGNRPAGEVIGYMNNGYIMTFIDGRMYQAHRLAWLYVYGEWPKHEIDHADGDRANNRIENLRDVPGFVNRQNRRSPQKNSTTGYLGVTTDKRTGNFIAYINHMGKSKYLGKFRLAEEAHRAYVDAKRRLHAGNTL